MQRVKRGRNSGLARDFLLESVGRQPRRAQERQAGLRLCIEVHPDAHVGERGHEKGWGRVGNESCGYKCPGTDGGRFVVSTAVPEWAAKGSEISSDRSTRDGSGLAGR